VLEVWSFRLPYILSVVLELLSRLANSFTKCMPHHHIRHCFGSIYVQIGSDALSMGRLPLRKSKDKTKKGWWNWGWWVWCKRARVLTYISGT